MTNSPKLGLLALGLLMAAQGRAAQTPLPASLSGERYAKMIERSPFVVATAVVAPVVAEASFAQNLYVAGIARMRFEGGEQKNRVTLKLRGEAGSGFSLDGTDPNKDGISVTDIDWSARVGQSKVTVKKGSEYAILEFDQQANMQSPPPNNNPGMPKHPGMGPGRPIPGAQNPGLPNGANNLNGQALGVPGGMGQPNRIQPGIPRPGNVPGMAPGAAVNPAMPGSAGAPDARRRIRVINSKPQ